MKKSMFDLLEESPIAVRVARRSDHKFLFGNRRYRQMFGLQGVDLKGFSPAKLYLNIQDFEEVMRRLDAGESITGDTFRMQTLDGTALTVHGSFSRFVFESQDAVVGWFYDVSHSHERLEFLLSQSPAVVYAFNAADFRTTYVSQNIDRMLGYQPADYLLGESFWADGLHVDDRDRVHGELAALWSKGLLSLEYRFRHKNGHYVWVHDNLQVVYDQRGEPAEVIGSWSDVTSRMEAEEQVREALQNKLLSDKATQMKSEFLANMSHEIRTPMNAIIGMAHLALKTELSPKQRDYLQKIQQSGQHLLGIINDILDFSKIEAGKLTIEKVDFEFNSIITNLANLISEKAAQKGLEIVFNIAPGLPHTLQGDPLRLSQILINYSNNAIKFTEKGTIVISVDVLEQTDKSVDLRFSVADTGIGLTKEQMGRLFQSFQQADAATTRKFGGTGLGLAISKQLATLMHGDVGVVSEVGRGSTFWFTARLGIGRMARKAAILREDLRGRRVLVIDDNEAARMSMRETLAASAFDVGVAQSGESAIEEVLQADLQRHPYELVLVDWHMPPGINGVDTARGIRKLPLKQQPKVMLVTAYAREDILLAAKEAGIGDVLAKPVNPSLLFETVVGLLGAVDHPGATKTVTPRDKAADLSALVGARVLLAEDNALNQQVASELLEDAGLIVEIAGDGEQALNLVKRKDFDIVLMDIQMPVMDGLQATAEIRKLKSAEELPILAMTANATVADRERCFAVGLGEHIPKPIDPAELFDALRRWIKPKARSTSTQESASPAKAETFSADSQIEGIDVPLGLKHVAGKISLYLKILAAFTKDEANATKRIRTALRAKDYATAERIAHTTKGASGSIGATGVQRLAATLEAKLHDAAARGDVEAELKELEKHIRAVIKAIKEVPAASPGAPPAAKARKGGIELAQRLMTQLANDDTAANALIEQEAAALGEVIGSDRFERVRGAIENYDYDSALATIRESLGNA